MSDMPFDGVVDGLDARPDCGAECVVSQQVESGKEKAGLPCESDLPLLSYKCEMKQSVWALVFCLAVVFDSGHSTAQTPISPRSVAPSERGLRVVTWNVWGVPYVTPQRTERISRMVPALIALDADLIALQEIWTDEDAKTFQDGLRAAGYPFIQRMSGEGRESGLMIASRFPMKQATFIRFLLGRTGHIPWHLDWKADKGMMIAKVLTPFGEVDFANTHLQSRYGDTGGYTSVRLGQMTQIAEALLLRGMQRTTILAGDFNSPTDDLPSRFLRAATRLEESVPYFGIDNILYRPVASTPLDVASSERKFVRPVGLGSETRRLSDHDALVVDFRIQPTQEVARSLTRVHREAKKAAMSELGARRVETALARAAFALFFVAAVILMRRRTRRVRVLGLLLVAVPMAWLAHFGLIHGPASVQGHKKLVAQLSSVENHARLAQFDSHDKLSVMTHDTPADILP